jgi:hypothetical protein
VAELYKPNLGGPDDASEVLADGALSFNRGRVEPAHEAWSASRKKPFYTVNVHWSSKGCGTTLHGDARPPVNGAVGRRGVQAGVIVVGFVSFSCLWGSNEGMLMMNDGKNIGLDQDNGEVYVFVL